MGDIGDLWNEMKPALKQRSMEKRANNREYSAEYLKSQGIDFTTNNDGVHLIVKSECGLIDFWPGTGKWKSRTGRYGRGVKSLVAHIKGHNNG